MSPPKGDSTSGFKKDVGNQTPKEYFNHLKGVTRPHPIKEEEYAVDIRLDAQNLEDSAVSLKNGVLKIRDQYAEYENFGDKNNPINVLQLRSSKKHYIPCILIRYTIIRQGKTKQFHCVVDKSTLYVCATTFGSTIEEKVQNHENKEEFRELPDFDDNGKLVRRFGGLLANNLSICYVDKPYEISFDIMLIAFNQLCGDIRDKDEDQKSLGVIYYVTSEPARFEPILEQVQRCILGFYGSVKEKTKLNYVLHWGDFSIAIEEAFRGNLEPLKALKAVADDKSTVESGINACRIVKVLKISNDNNDKKRKGKK